MVSGAADASIALHSQLSKGPPERPQKYLNCLNYNKLDSNSLSHAFQDFLDATNQN